MPLGREEIFQTARSWREAKNECEASGMRLAVINNKVNIIMITLVNKKIAA